MDEMIIQTLIKKTKNIRNSTVLISQDDVKYLQKSHSQMVDIIQEMKSRTCENCNWYRDGLCCNGSSPLYADFVSEDFRCNVFKRKPEWI